MVIFSSTQTWSSDKLLLNLSTCLQLHNRLAQLQSLSHLCASLFRYDVVSWPLASYPLPLASNTLLTSNVKLSK